MQKEIMLKYYDSKSGFGFNNPREGIYDNNNNEWLQPKVHIGRLVYGNKRIPYKQIKPDKCNFVVQEYCPF